MHRAGADAECLGRFEDTRARHQFRPNTLNDIGAHRATPEPFSCAQARARPRLMPLRTIDHSNSANAPVIW
jgi:hypothetical protein